MNVAREFGSIRRPPVETTVDAGLCAAGASAAITAAPRHSRP